MKHFFALFSRPLFRKIAVISILLIFILDFPNATLSIDLGFYPESAPLGPLPPNEVPSAPGLLQPEQTVTHTQMPAQLASAVEPDPLYFTGCPAGKYCAYLPMAYSNATAFYSPERSAAKKLYQTDYLSSNNILPTWTGSIGACDAGQTSQAFKDAVLQRVNYFRETAGVPKLEGFLDTYNEMSQAAALMMSANKLLSHEPGEGWICYTSLGYNGAGSSNLYLGSYGPDAISGYMRDPGKYNTVVGHRRWILYPQSRNLGTGDIPGGLNPAANSFHSFDANIWGPRPATRNPFVAWPPSGYVPYQVVYPRWSFSYPEANFDSAFVQVSHNGVMIPVTRYTPAYGYGEATLAWLVNNMTDFQSWPQPATDESYTVTVGNVIIDGAAQKFIYTVTIFDPAQ